MKRFTPSKKQLEFMEWEFGVFFHFGIRTFNEDRYDWDGIPMDVNTFNPTNLDCEQWIKTIKEAGAKYAVFTAKHHDGFANWPSKFTEYGVKNTPWKDGKGDVVREFTDACRKYGLKVGIYYSPAQFGYKEVKSTDYDDYFINQISELLTNYGKIDYLWFDGCGSEGHEYDRDRIIKCIRGLQPEILIFSMWDPDTLWVGNEEGVAPLDSADILNEWGKFLPYECDCKIRRKTWFYNEKDKVRLRTPEDIMGLYDTSIGRGGNLLLNIGPDARGLLPKEDSENLLQFSKDLRERFKNPLDVEITQEGNSFTIKPKGDFAVAKTVVLKEDIKTGESIRGFSLKYQMYHVPACLHIGKSVGRKRIVNIPPMYMDKDRCLKLDITEVNGELNPLKIEVY